MAEEAPLRVQATKPAQLPAFIKLSYGEDTEKSLTETDYGHYVPYKEPSDVYAFVFNESIKDYKKKHPDARRYYGSIDFIRKLYVFDEGDEDVSLFLNFDFVTSVISAVPQDAAELQIRFYFRQEGQDFDGKPKDEQFKMSPMHNMVYPKHLYYVHFPSLAQKAYVGESVNNLANGDFSNSDFELYGDVDTPNPVYYDFGDDGFYEKQILPATKIPVLTKGLKWVALAGYGDPDSMTKDDDPEGVKKDDTSYVATEVAGVNDLFINLPPIVASFAYDFTGDKISVKISNIEFGDSTDSPLSGNQHVITISEEKPNCAALGFMGLYDDKFNEHTTWPVFWVRVDKAYADAHPKEVRKRGYFYYRKEDIGDWFNWDDDHILQQISCDDDLEYSISIDDLQPFKDRINQFVHDTYGGFDVPLSMPTLLKWSRYEHAGKSGNSIALNVFVHPKGVL